MLAAWFGITEKLSTLKIHVLCTFLLDWSYVVNLLTCSFWSSKINVFLFMEISSFEKESKSIQLHVKINIKQQIIKYINIYFLVECYAKICVRLWFETNLVLFRYTVREIWTSLTNWMKYWLLEIEIVNRLLWLLVYMQKLNFLVKSVKYCICF